MKTCDCCAGFIVEGAGCPNCAVDRARGVDGAARSSRWARVAAAVVAAGTAVTLAACYGLPPTPDQDAGPTSDAGTDSGESSDAAARD
jgi:hypothetical protein